MKQFLILCAFLAGSSVSIARTNIRIFTDMQTNGDTTVEKMIPPATEPVEITTPAVIQEIGRAHV